MNFLSIVILCFAILGAIDYIIGNKIGVGAEFENAFYLFAPMALTMIGMLVIAPAIGVWLSPLFDGFYNLFGIDPSIIPASLFANDMGGAALAQSIFKSEQIGKYNAFVISTMMGCTMSFNIPFGLGVVKKEQHPDFFFGLICGIATIPLGSFVAGLICGINPLLLLINLLPLIIISVAVTLMLIFVPKIAIKCFSVFGVFMKILCIVGLAIAIFTHLTGIIISPHFDSLESAAIICVYACITLAGALPAMYLISKLLQKPLNILGGKIGINAVSTLGFLGSLVTNTSSYGVMDKMDKKGVILNSAFAVSASFVFGAHLAFTMAVDSSYILPVIVGKILSGICAVILALILTGKNVNNTDKSDKSVAVLK